MSPRLQHRLPLLLLVAFVGWQWRRIGAPPLRTDSPWDDVGLVVLLMGLMVRVVAPSLGAPRWVPVLAGAAAAGGLVLWLAVLGRSLAHSPHVGRVLLVVAALLAYEAWVWWRWHRPLSSTERE